MAQLRKLSLETGMEQDDPMGGNDAGMTPPPAGMTPAPPQTGEPPDVSQEGRSETTPRENQPPQGAAPVTSTPKKPAEPSPMAGSSFQPPPIQGVQPFAPLPSQPGVSLAKSRSQALYGSSGGLQGGGLGVPFDPVSDAQSDPISGLLQMLMKSKRGLF
jgi:hypothetical protein